MLASFDKAFKESLITFGKHSYLRAVLIYGANGSGKSSVLNAMAVMSRHVRESYGRKIGDHLYIKRHKLHRDKPETFSISFEKNGVEYSYQFSCDGKSYPEESLYYKPEGRIAKLFTRTGKDVSYGTVFSSKDKAICKKELTENRLLLSVASNVISIPEIKCAFSYFKDDLFFEDNIYVIERTSSEDSVANAINDNPSIKERIIKIFNQLGSDLVDILIEDRQDDENLITNKEILTAKEYVAFSKLFGKQWKEAFESVFDRILKYKVTMVYPDYSIELLDESSGTMRLIMFLCSLISALDNGKTIICDELEAKFHPSLVKELLKICLENRDSTAQLVCTTHNTSLLDLNLVRRDQVYFTELRKGEGVDRSTDLYSLAEIRNVRNNENIQEGYLSGKYGAIPGIRFDESLFSDEEEY